MCSGSISSGAVTHARSGTLTMRDKSDIMQKQQLTKEFHKPIITKFKKTKVYASFKDNIMEADVANVKLISKFYKGIRFFIMRY